MQKQFRLKSSRTFNVVYRKGSSYSNKYLVVMLLKRRDGKVKVGFTVSKKIGNSVTRNKVRRRLKESFRQLIPQVEKSYTYVVLARKPIVDIDYHTINDSLVQLLIKSKKLSV